MRGHILLRNMSVFVGKTTKSGERLYLGAEPSLEKHSRLASVVNEHYDRNYSSPSNGFKFHACRGGIFVLRVLDCNEEWWFFLQRKNLNKYKFKKLWIAFSEKNCLSKYKAYNLGNFSTFAATLKILHPQCIAISVCTLPGFIKDLSLGQVPLLRNYRSALVIQITFLLSKLKVILKKSYLSHLSTDCNH